MTNIKDLQERINSAETVLAELKTNLQELKEQEKDKEPESLFGRWATHPEHGRGIIGSDKPDDDKEVRFIFYCDNSVDGVKWEYERLGDLTLDPATLNTTEDFDNAPEGTIIEGTTGLHDVYLKCQSYWLVAGDIEEANHTTFPPCRVIRWGNGQ